MASEDLKDNLNETTDTNMNKFTVRWGYCSYKSVGTEYNYNLDCYNVFFSLFLPLHPQGGSFPLYSPSWTLFTIHLLIIWVATWVFVPSDILSDLLCVVVVYDVPFLFFSPSILREGPSPYIVPLELSLPYTCWSFGLLLEYFFHQTPFLTFCALWLSR